jgi:hypothetical protein
MQRRKKMPKETELNRCLRVLEDHEKRITALEGKPVNAKTKIKAWYKSERTTEKVLFLAKEGFFNKSRPMSELISELKTKDYHLKPSDLTLS